MAGSLHYPGARRSGATIGSTLTALFLALGHPVLAGLLALTLALTFVLGWLERDTTTTGA